MVRIAGVVAVGEGVAASGCGVGGDVFAVLVVSCLLPRPAG
jgi:hypothetical protein